MLRRLVATASALVLPALAAAPANGAPSLLMPGVTYERQVQFTAHGPVAIHVMTAPKPGGLWSVRPVLSNGAVVATERVTQMQRAASRDATVAGINGDLFTADGRPAGILVQSGALHHPPRPDRSSVGFAADGTLRVERVRYFGTWRGNGQRRPVDLNQPPSANGIAIFTPAWGPVTPRLDNAVEVVLRGLPSLSPNVEHAASVGEVKQGSAGATPIPPDGAVIAAQGANAPRLLGEAPLGSTVNLRLVLTPAWPDVREALGGGPVLVRARKPVFRHGETFAPEQLARNSRAAVGQLRDGRLLFVVVDGRRPGYSTGMTSFELAQTLLRLGAVTGSGLDGGSSATMAFEGALLNRPSDPSGERPVSEGLFVLYAGAYAAPPTEPVLSPNGDGVGDVQGFAYKLVRPSRATVTLVGPRGVRRELAAGEKAAGAYRLSWNGLAPGNRPEPEGAWRLTVQATDDLGRESRADRLFSLNRTLGGLSVSPSAVAVGPRGGRAAAQFTLTRQARVTVTVETAAGLVVAQPARRAFGAGRHTVAWNGRVGRRALANTGRYVLRVTAQNGVGATSLAAPFAVRRVAAGR